MDVNAILGYISSTTIMGFLPLDVLAHFVIGLLLALFLINIGLKNTTIFLILLVIALFKEYLDSTTLGHANTLLEKIKDVFFTLLPLLFVAMAQHAKLDSPRSL